jgi:hypothetical protein
MTADRTEKDTGGRPNVDEATVASFGNEWAHFDQSSLDDAERRHIFGQYFGVFPWDALPAAAEGFDMGGGSGRWAKLAAPRRRNTELHRRFTTSA